MGRTRTLPSPGEPGFEGLTKAQRASVRKRWRREQWEKLRSGGDDCSITRVQESRRRSGVSEADDAGVSGARVSGGSPGGCAGAVVGVSAGRASAGPSAAEEVAQGGVSEVVPQGGGARVPPMYADVVKWSDVVSVEVRGLSVAGADPGGWPLERGVQSYSFRALARIHSAWASWWISDDGLLCAEESRKAFTPGELLGYPYIVRQGDVYRAQIVELKNELERRVAEVELLERECAFLRRQVVVQPRWAFLWQTGQGLDKGAEDGGGREAEGDSCGV